MQLWGSILTYFIIFNIIVRSIDVMNCNTNKKTTKKDFFRHKNFTELRIDHGFSVSRAYIESQMNCRYEPLLRKLSRDCPYLGIRWFDLYRSHSCIIGPIAT